MAKRKDRKSRAGQPVPLDTAQWSQASRRSLAAEFADSHYRDLTQRCIACKGEFVFSAEQQRDAFERRKAYIAQQRLLCAQCWAHRLGLIEELKRIRSHWNRDRAGSKRDLPMLLRWQQVLAQLPRYGLREDRAQRAMVDRWVQAARRAD